MHCFENKFKNRFSSFLSVKTYNTKNNKNKDEDLPNLEFKSEVRNNVEYRIDPFMKVESRLNPARANRPKQGADPNDTTFLKMLENAAGTKHKNPNKTAAQISISKSI